MIPQDMLAKLGDHNEVIPCGYEEWVPWALENLFHPHGPGAGRCMIAKYRNVSGVVVSTVFLGMNTSPGKPKWFETMVFGGPLDGERAHYETCAEAEAGHAEMIVRVQRAPRRS